MVDSGLYIWDVPHLNDIFYNCLIKISTNSGKATQISQKFTIVNQTNKIQIKNIIEPTATPVCGIQSKISSAP